MLELVVFTLQIVVIHNGSGIHQTLSLVVFTLQIVVIYNRKR